MKIEHRDIGTERAELALERLASGSDSVLFENVSLQNIDSEEIEISIWSDWGSNQITRLAAKEELSKGKLNFEQLLTEWHELSTLLSGKVFSYSLKSDYGMGASQILTASNSGEIDWKI